MESAAPDLPLAVGPVIIRMLGIFLGIMDFVITLVAPPGLHTLTPAFADTMAARLAAQGLPVRKTHWLAENTALDLIVTHDDRRRVDAIVQSLLGAEKIDAVAQPVNGRRKQLLISDMDSTMITIECIDELADFVGKKREVSQITQRAMNGELDFKAALSERVALLAGLPESVLQEAYDQRVRFMPGARELVSTMSRSGAYCVLVSGGFTFFTSRVAHSLGFQEDHANRLEIAGGKLTGRVIPPVLGKEAKLESLRQSCATRNIPLEAALAVGDGANDLPMLQAAGLGVAYHAQPFVRAQAHARINHHSLRALLYVQGYEDRQITA